MDLIQINIIFSVSNNWGKNAIILEVDSSLSLHINNNKKKNPAQELDDTKITAEAILLILQDQKEKCSLNMHYNISNGYLCDFSVDCNIIDIGDIIIVDKYLMKKHDIK